ncbi:MAG: hypothetical protein DRJ61_14235 [Acidobacteria bacterium]|nr:MAG: hypothetical protein DRJ61_14235 [Acidobacteriota bacterium]
MEYKIINSISELPEFDKELPIFSDIETSGLYTNLRMCQFLQPQTTETIFIVDIAPTGFNEETYQIELQQLKDYICQHHTVWYNSSYDLGTMDISPDRVDDLFYVIKSAYPAFQEFGLKKVVKKLRYTQGLYDSTEEDHGSKSYPKGSYISRSGYRYAAIDVLALSLMWNDTKVQHIIKSNIAYKVDMLSQKYSLVYQRNGLLLNRGNWKKELARARLDYEYWSLELPTDLNPNSYIQVRKFLGTEKSDAEALIAYSLSNKPLASKAAAIIKVKKYRKEVSYLESINYDRMITKFNPAGAISGRFTSAGGDLENGFNAQQIPRQFQYLFNSATKDTVVIDADYSTLELRLACTIFGSEHMRQQLKDGRDLHTDMVLATNPNKELHPDGVIKSLGTEIDTGKYVTSEDRVKAKAVNFGFCFGMSAPSFVNYAYTSYGVEYTQEGAVNVRNGYFKLYPEFKKHHSSIWNNYKDRGFTVQTALGRRVKPRLGTDGINIPVQGSGAETTKLAVHYLVIDNPGYNILGWIYNVVHDAIYMRVPRDEDYKHIGTLLEAAMLKAWVEIGKTPSFKFKDIPMIAEVEINE